PEPSSCETDGGSDSSVPIGTIIGSQNSAVPTATAARVSVPWWPAMALSTKPIRPVDRCPATSGAARIAVVRTSRPKPGAGVVDAIRVCRNAASAYLTGRGSRGDRPRDREHEHHQLPELRHRAARAALLQVRAA